MTRLVPMLPLLDLALPSDEWASLWARLTHELLTSIATLEREGEAHWGDDLDTWVTEYGFEDSLEAIVKAAFDRPHSDYQAAVSQALVLFDASGKDDEDDLTGRLFEALEEHASVGTWFDPEGDGSFGLDLTGDTLLFGMGFTVTAPFANIRRDVEDARQLDAIAAALVRDGQVVAGHRLVLLPVFLDANSREQLDEWRVNRLRAALEDWMVAHPAGHPTPAQAWELLADCGIEARRPFTYARLDGTYAHESAPEGYGVFTWTLLGVVASSEVPLAQSAFILNNIAFPRAEIPSLLRTLAEEAEVCGRDLETAEERGSYEAQVFLLEELKRIEFEVGSLQAAFSDILTQRPRGGTTPHEALESLVQRALATVRMEPCVDALTCANEFFPAWRDVVASHRKLAFEALLTVSALRAGLDEPRGLVALLGAGTESGEVRVRLMDGEEEVARLPWPSVGWQSPYDSTAELLGLLQTHGVRTKGVK